MASHRAAIVAAAFLAGVGASYVCHAIIRAALLAPFVDRKPHVADRTRPPGRPSRTQQPESIRRPARLPAVHIIHTPDGHVHHSIHGADGHTHHSGRSVKHGRR